MNKTQIEWVRNPDGSQGYTWNPITGCLNHDNGLCKGGGFPCYAYKLANTRLKNVYLSNPNVAAPYTGGSYTAKALDDPFYPRFWEDRLSQPIGYAATKQVEGVLTAIPPKGKGIFVCDMGDLFGIGVPEEWTRKVLRIIEHTSYNRYYLLTKQAQRLPEFSPFPDKCWVGVTATNLDAVIEATKWLKGVKANVKYLSLEPLLDWSLYEKPLTKRLLGYAEVNWLIIGACTSQDHWELEAFNYHHDSKLQLRKWGKRWTLQPQIEWLKEIVSAADKAGVKVFLKDNLKPLIEANKAFPTVGIILRQELPNG